jgi:hypothetical protein
MSAVKSLFVEMVEAGVEKHDIPGSGILFERIKYILPGRICKDAGENIIRRIW